MRKIGIMIASGVLGALGFNSCHLPQPKEYGTPMHNPKQEKEEQSDNSDNSANPKKKERKIREDLEVVKPLYGVQPNPRSFKEM